MRSRPVVLALAGLAIVPGSALAGTRSYAGVSNEGAQVAFRASSSSIRAFTTGVELRCVNSGKRMEAITLPRVRVRKGRFVYDGLMNGSYLYLEGRIRGRRASGKLRFISSGRGTEGDDFCGSSPVRWSARVR